MLSCVFIVSLVVEEFMGVDKNGNREVYGCHVNDLWKVILKGLVVYSCIYFIGVNIRLLLLGI